MATIITTPDGANSIVMDFSDFNDLVEEYLGSDARSWLEGYIFDTYGTEAEIDAIIDEYEKEQTKLRDRYKEVMADLRAEAEKLAGLICQKELDRKAISNTAGRIGTITWREVNRR